VNHLAHLFLAGENKGLTLGNFIADMVKGKNFLKYEPAIQQGILMHRQIDQYTDSHPSFRQSCKRVRPILGKFAGMAMDVIYDYYLSNHWKEYTTETLEGFAQRKIALLDDHRALFPEHSQRFLDYLKIGGVLYSYGKVSTLTKVFEGMARRTVITDNPLRNTPMALQQHHEALEGDFNIFFGEAIQHFKNYPTKDASNV
jgi:acyl carrier protein phosphodiesterase